MSGVPEASIQQGSPIYSMTGYASMRVDMEEQASFTLSLKSVNHRFLDLQLRMPQSSDGLEPLVRKVLKEQIHRGHVEFGLQLDRQARTGIAINHEQVAAYIEAFRSVAGELGMNTEPDLNDVLRQPGMLSTHQTSSKEDAGPIEAAVLAQLPELVIRFNAVRAEEGRLLALELQGAMRRIDELAGEVSTLREGARELSFERLRARITELTQGTTLSDERLMAEAALLVDRSDIEEELVRLRTHATGFLGMLEQGGPLGKRLDFLLQELNREANTLLSKTGGASSQNGLRITELGLQMKVEIERAREQIQNLE